MNPISAKAWQRAAAKRRSPPRWAIRHDWRENCKRKQAFKRWESERSAGSLVSAVIALLGLATLDLIFLIPFVCVVGAILIAMFAVSVSLFFAGGAVWLLAIFPGLMIFGSTGILGSGLALWLAGLGLIAAAVGLAGADLVAARYLRPRVGALRKAAFPPAGFRQHQPVQK